jgi:hypothetical protein
MAVVAAALVSALVPAVASAALAAPVAAQLAPPAHRATSPRASRAAAAATPKPALAPASVGRGELFKAPAQVASDARVAEENGAYAVAADRLRELRARVAPDADLEIALAIDEARSSQSDSAWARLSGRQLMDALQDEGDATRHRDYPFQREPLWLNGTFDGWHWYIARARAELALQLRRWNDAYDAAMIAMRARPQSGKDHLLAAIAAGRAGDLATARREADAAAMLDPLLPEAQYLSGLHAWRAGDRAGAMQAFHRAIGIDSSYRAPALALARLRVPGIRPDSLPVRFLTGVRATCMLTSPLRPKLEEYVQNDVLAGLLGAPHVTFADSVKTRMALKQPLQFFVTVLVDEQGHPVADDLPWIAPGQVPDAAIVEILRTAATWRFRPASKLSQNVRSWATVQLTIAP